ncbi:eggshell protein, putative [Schistosoma mansoni]|uniref:Eggshell protein, putative n=1 Tax=Schistosoma mansoni TaxID=6183 RepID=G4LYJ6_SCHMA|nr:eggshell protein, putative [Schistosoma mansoni]|eukprot:XP_018646330.1 eggshell protein, putative [Schistosoma mansoni]
MKSVISLYLLVIISCTFGGESYIPYTPYSNDNYGTYTDNGQYNNNNDYYGGDKNHGNDNHGKIHTQGKFIAYGNADKGLKYHQTTYFHKGSKYQKKFANYDTKGKVHSYGKQNVKAKFNIESKLYSKGKYNGGKFDQLAGTGSGQYSEGQIPIEYAAYGSGSTYNAPTNYDTTNNNYYDQNNGESSNDNGYSADTYQPQY